MDKVDMLNGAIFLPEEGAYVKAVLRQNGFYPCALENIILLQPDEEYILRWSELPVSHQRVSYHTDGHTRFDKKDQTRVLHATYFVVFGGPKSGLPFLAARIVLWRPYARLWEVAAWLQKEAIKRL